MNLHFSKELFGEYIRKKSYENDIDMDILEKDYYVCCILKQLSENQEDLQGFFKGGTALYKILNEMRRFSEDIDLTINYDKGLSKSQNVKRMEKATFNYVVRGLNLEKESSIKNGRNCTVCYKYDSIFDIGNQQLYRAGLIKVESTLFTISEPVEFYCISPLIYELSNKEEREVLSTSYDVRPFRLKIIKLERIFVDKIFATEFYYIRKNYSEAAKHLYDICVLMDNEVIKEFLKEKESVMNIIEYKRREEEIRTGGIDANVKMQLFTYLNENFTNEFKREFERMQYKYVYKDKYLIKIEECECKLDEIKKILIKYDV